MAAEVVVLVLVEQEILLQQLLLKEIQVVINFTRDQVMVVEAAVVTLQQVLMVHQVPEVLVEQEQILVQHMETLAQHVQYSVVEAVVEFMKVLEPQELVEQVGVELGLMDQVVMRLELLIPEVVEVAQGKEMLVQQVDQES